VRLRRYSQAARPARQKNEGGSCCVTGACP
jgi:hypothetical protein